MSGNKSEAWHSFHCEGKNNDRKRIQTTGPLGFTGHLMTLSDFHVLWFAHGIAVMLGLEALKKQMQKATVN